jgi:thymidylate kinase
VEIVNPPLVLLIQVTFDEETIRKFKEDKAHFDQFRREIEHEQHMSYLALLQGSEMAVEVHTLAIVLISGTTSIRKQHEAEVGCKERNLRTTSPQLPSRLSQIDSRSRLPRGPR